MSDEWLDIGDCYSHGFEKGLKAGKEKIKAQVIEMVYQCIERDRTLVKLIEAIEAL